MIEEEQPLVSNLSAKLLRRRKICMGVSIGLAATFLTLAIVLPFFLTWVISLEAAKQIPMAPDNEFLWAHLPGSTQTFIHRNFTFFNFTNPKEVIYLGHRPVFH
jgi:hypothetical protein